MTRGGKVEAGGGATRNRGPHLPMWFEVLTRVVPPVLSGVVLLAMYYITGGVLFDWRVNSLMVLLALTVVGLGVVALPALESTGPVPRRVRRSVIAIKAFTLWTGTMTLILQAIAFFLAAVGYSGSIAPNSSSLSLRSWLAWPWLCC